MAEVHIEGDTLHIDLSLADKILAVHGSMRIPLQHIAGITVADESAWGMMWRKIIGTNAPGIKIAGTFFSGDGLVFCDFRDGKSCLQINVTHETYTKIIVQLDDLSEPQRIASDLQAAITAYQSAPPSIKK